MKIDLIRILKRVLNRISLKHTVIWVEIQSNLSQIKRQFVNHQTRSRMDIQGYYHGKRG